MNTRTQSRKLAFEQVENREMMAGNVSAAIYGGELVIVGDDQSNSIQVTEVSDRVVEINAINGTTINGASVAYFYNPSDKLNAYMNGGDDVLQILTTQGHRTTTFNNVFINMGSGRDGLGISDTAIFGNSTLIMGADWENDTDVLVLGGKLIGTQTPPITNFWANLDIKTGGGGDYVYFLDKTNVYGNLSLRTGDGDDQVQMERLLAYKDFYADLGNGDDQMNAGGLDARGNVYIDAGWGNDLYLGSSRYMRWINGTLSRFDRFAFGG